MNPAGRDIEHARRALEHLAVLRRHVERHGLDDEVSIDAVCLRLASSIEAASRLSDGARDDAFGTSWPAIWATRNRIAHDYLEVDRAIIPATVEVDLPAFEESLARLTRRLGS